MVEEITKEAMIYHGPGGCCNCGDLLTVIDHEMTIMELNRDGHPLTEETILRVKAICPKCGHKQDMMRHNGTYIPYSKSNEIFKIFHIKEEAKKRLSLLNNKAREENPFSI